MSCHKVTRELLDRFRFGQELDAGCDPYLEHLETCRDCQQAIAVDRTLAQNLRRALRERVEGFEPSPAVWRAVRIRASDPHPPGAWWSTALSRLGRATRVAVPVTAVLLAALLGWVNGDSGVGDATAGARELATRLQWEEQLNVTAAVESEEPAAEVERIEFPPSPSQQLKRSSGDMPFAEPLTSIKVYSNQLPTGGGVIR